MPEGVEFPFPSLLFHEGRTYGQPEVVPISLPQVATGLRSRLLNNPVPVSLLSGDRKPQIRFLGNHHSGSGNLYHKSFRM